MRIRELTHHHKKARLVELGLSIDTRRAGDHSGRVRVEFGGSRVELPVTTKVPPSDPTLTKVLVITPGFGEASEDPGYYRTWFEFVKTAGLDASYLDPSIEGLPDFVVDQGGEPAPPEWLERFDAILVVDGGPIYIRGTDVLRLQKYVQNGGRLVVGASHFMEASVPNANLVLAPFGLEMQEKEVIKGRRGDNRGWALFSIEGDHIRPDPLTHGIDKVMFGRATPVRTTMEGHGEILLRDPAEPSQGFAAVSRDGGEVIVLGPSLFFHWLDKEEGGVENARFLRNLLTKTRR